METMTTENDERAITQDPTAIPPETSPDDGLPEMPRGPITQISIVLRSDNGLRIARMTTFRGRARRHQRDRMSSPEYDIIMDYVSRQLYAAGIKPLPKPKYGWRRIARKFRALLEGRR